MRLLLAFAVVTAATVLVPVGRSHAQTTAVIGTSSHDEAAVAYVVSTVEGARRRTVPTGDLVAVRRMAAGWRAHTVVMIDVDRGFVVALRTRDGRSVERRLAPSVAQASAYAVAVVAAELVDLLSEQDAPSRLRVPPRVRRRRPTVAAIVRAGPSLAIALDGDVILPRVVVDVGVGLRPPSWPIVLELALGVAPGLGLDHDVPRMRAGDDHGAAPDGSAVRYVRHDLTASVGAWSARGRLSLGGGAVLALGLGTARALDRDGSTLGDDTRVIGSLGGFAGLRVRLGSGFFLGISWTLDGLPANRRFLVLGTPALEEGGVRLTVGLDVGWDSGDRSR